MLESELLNLLRTALGKPDAAFHRGQLEAIIATVTPPRRALVVQATGWGKSMVYFLATKVLRSEGAGPTIVISPLLSLMRNQTQAASRLGLRTARYDSSNQGEWPEIEAQISKDTVDLLLISPERLGNSQFQDFLQNSNLGRAGLIVIDEAHCISDWGHDFRPDYQRLGELTQRLPRSTAVLATTATANRRVVDDIVRQLGEPIRVVRGSLARTSLSLQVFQDFDVATRLAWLSDHLTELPGSGIIYTLTVRDAERVADWLQSRGHNVLPYHGQLGGSGGIEGVGDVREAREQLLLNDGVKALVATVALGMGFDKPNLGFVVHFQSPANLVAYYQQVGRAGRAIRNSLAVLFLGDEDSDIHNYFIKNALPTNGQIQTVLAAIEDAEEGIAQRALEAKVNLRSAQIERVISYLEVLKNSPIVKTEGRFRRTPNVYTPDEERRLGLEAQRRSERTRMVEFSQTDRCLMQLVREELDDPDTERCGNCSNCRGGDLVPRTVDRRTLDAALEFLGRSSSSIRPRKRWFAGATSHPPFKGTIAAEERCDEGLCLSRWGDPGIGVAVREGKRAGHFGDDLISAASAAILRWSPDPFPAWVCAVPSLRNPIMVPYFAQRLAKQLGLPYRDAVIKVRETEPQKSQQNSFFQSKNLDGAFAAANPLPGTVLLVDDMVDSGWTFTMIGALLRRAGAARVIPFALASTASVGDDE